MTSSEKGIPGSRAGIDPVERLDSPEGPGLSKGPDPPDELDSAGTLRRLHPMTLALRLVVSVPAMVFLLLPTLRHPDSGSVFNLIMAILYAAIVVPWLVIHYLRFRYRITEREILIESGVATIRRRSIPIERVQNVEIEQQLLQRMTGTARVRVFTAGSPKPEGSLEVVSLAEAERIRTVVRRFQRMVPAPGAADQGRSLDADGRQDGSADDHTDSGYGRSDLESAVVGRAAGQHGAGGERLVSSGSGQVLFTMDLPRVLLSGTFRFSMLYVALAFSLLQYWTDDPNEILSLFMRGPLAGLGELVLDSPVMALVAGALLATIVAWLSGILVNLNRWYDFAMTLEEGKLQLSYGLLSKRRTTIPLRKVQMLIVRTNPLMRPFGWYMLQVQTMGFDVREQGHAIVVPFARISDVRRIAAVIRRGMPDHGAQDPWPEDLLPVSRLTIRRAFIRYALAAAVVTALAVWEFSTLGWFGLLLLPVALVAAVIRWVHMGYALEHDHLVVRRGFFRQTTWIMPVQRVQVVYTRSSIFQRRLGLRTVYVDTAGANPVSSPDLIDVTADEADRLTGELYTRFQALAA